MKRISFLALFFIACGGPVSAVSETERAVPCKTEVKSEDGGRGSACVLTVDVLDPSGVFYGQAHNTLVIARGCGFLGVKDVQVNVTSVPFLAVDDKTLVFAGAREPLDTSTMTFPYRAEIDIIRTQLDQVQTFFTYTK